MNEAISRTADAESNYPVGLNLMGRRVVVVGGGTAAQRRLGPLVSAGARVHIISCRTTPAVEEMAANGLVTLELRKYRAGDLDGAWYALACTNDPDTDSTVASEAEGRRIFCMYADVPRFGTAISPTAASRTEIAECAEPSLPGVALVGGGPGDPDLITVRGRRLLARADVVVVDRLAPSLLLAELDPRVEVIDAAKIPYGRQMSQDTINLTLIDRAKAGKFVVRLKGGDPYVFGRGYEELEACAAAGVPVTVVPGITSAISVPAAAGIPVTHRGVTHEFVVVSGHIPPNHQDSLTNWDALARLRGTLVLLMAIENIDRIVEALIRGGRPADSPATVVQEGTLHNQRTLRGSLGTVAGLIHEEGVRPPSVVVIGPVAGFGAQPTATWQADS